MLSIHRYLRLYLISNTKTIALKIVTDLINQVSQLLRAELKELVDVVQATMEPIEPYDKE